MERRKKTSMENDMEAVDLERSEPYQADLFDADDMTESAASAGAEAAALAAGKTEGAGEALVEAVLFLEPEPVDVKQIARITGLTEDEVEAALEGLKERYARGGGIEITGIGGGITIAPKKELWETLKERYGRRNTARLSRAAMETLAIIAYSQPVTRAEIEAIRGVQADNMIRLLLERGLIREAGKKDIAGRPVQFGTTKEFLSLFRLESIADLPKLDESDAERFEQ
jgi:segregation and condensation protein B